jgi:hypothetical protein
MPLVSFSIPNENINAFIESHSEGWTATIVNDQGETVANPITRAEYARQTVLSDVKKRHVDYNVRKATGIAAQTIEDARLAAVAQANTVTIT